MFFQSRSLVHPRLISLAGSEEFSCCFLLLISYSLSLRKRMAVLARSRFQSLFLNFIFSSIDLKRACLLSDFFKFT